MKFSLPTQVYILSRKPQIYYLFYFILFYFILFYFIFRSLHLL
jgi:hypothetical protein